MVYTKTQIKDKRSWEQVQKNYNRGLRNEERAVHAVMDHLIFTSGYLPDQVHFKKIDPDENLADGRVHITPDVYLFVGNKTYSLEVKVFLTKIEHSTIPLKPAPFWEMLHNPEQYPNPYVLYCENERWSMMPASKVVRYPCPIHTKWSTSEVSKRAFLIPIGDFQYKNYVTKPKFEQY